MTTSTALPRRRQGPRPDPAIDEAVLAATRRLLVEHGYSATSIDLIARTAKVSRPAIYRRWRSKAALVHTAAFPHLNSGDRQDDLAGEITRLCRGALAMYSDPVVREAVPGLLDDLRTNPPMRRLINERLEAAARRQVSEQLADAVSQGIARRSAQADTIMDVIAGAAWYAVCVRRVKDISAAADDLADLILHGALT